MRLDLCSFCTKGAARGWLVLLDLRESPQANSALMQECFNCYAPGPVFGQIWTCVEYNFLFRIFSQSGRPWLNDSGKQACSGGAICNYLSIYYNFSRTKLSKTFSAPEKCLHGSKWDQKLKPQLLFSSFIVFFTLIYYIYMSIYI